MLFILGDLKINQKIVIIIYFLKFFQIIYSNCIASSFNKETDVNYRNFKLITELRNWKEVCK